MSVSASLYSCVRPLSGATVSCTASLGLFLFPLKMDVGKVYPKETESFCKQSPPLPHPVQSFHL